MRWQARQYTRSRQPGSSGARQTRLGLLFVSPWIIGFCVFYLYPFFATLYYSFTSFTGIGNPVFTGLANYSGLLHDATFRTALFNTFYYTIIEVPFSTAAALGLALLLNMNVRGQAIYRTLFYIPSIVPVVASSLIFVWIFQPSFGIVNALLSDVHINGPAWFFSITWSKPTFILLGLWGLGQPMVIYLAALQGVPKEMYEVAVLEGAGPWQRLRNVTIPMISPIILFNVILSLVLSIQYFTQAQVIETPPGSPGNSTMFYVTLLLPAGVPVPAPRIRLRDGVPAVHPGPDHHRRTAEDVVALGLLRERAEVTSMQMRIAAGDLGSGAGAAAHGRLAPRSRRARRRLGASLGKHSVLIVLSAMFALPLVWMVGTSFKTAQQALTLPVVWWPHPFLWSNYPDLFAALPYFRFFLEHVPVRRHHHRRRAAYRAAWSRTASPGCAGRAGTPSST